MRKHLKDFFIPHESNEYKPHSLQKIAITGMVVMVFLSFAFANMQSILWITSDWMVSTVLPAVIIDLTNNERSEAALDTLRRNTTLDEAAELKAQDMAKHEYFAHFSPDGVSPWHWFAVADYNFVHAGENLAIYFTDSADVVDAWMDSPAHRANIMNADYSEIGVGTAEGMFEGYNTVYVVQLFGTPAAHSLGAGSVAPVAQAAEVVPKPEPAIVVVAETQPTSTAELISEPKPVPVDDEQSDVLAQEVSLTQDITIVPADPEPVAEVDVATTSEVAIATEVANMSVTENGIALFSDHVSSSTGAIPASILPDEPQTSNNVPYIFGMLTQPHLVLQILYVVISIFVLGSLLLSVLIEIRRQQPVQIVYSVALLALMMGLFYVHTVLTSGAVVV